MQASSSATLKWKYDVFLSFRGEDTRKSFTDHLYAALERRGISAFRDDERLERGKPISKELFKAIEDSRFSVVVFSRNYASSTWCLDELAKIVECMKLMGQTVLPVFYHVDPSEVRKQEGNFGDAFVRHGEDFKGKELKVQTWRDALVDVANLSGWDLRDRHESKVNLEIVDTIFKKVSYSFCNTNKNIVGMESQVTELIHHMDLETNDSVRTVGICGMGGIGKTTLAEVVFDKISGQFEGSSFLANVREISKNSGLVTLQQQLLSEILVENGPKIWSARLGANIIKKQIFHKKVLLILDDVDGLDQLKNLAGDQDWFGLGSRIIITTRDEHLLITHGVDSILKLKGMSHFEAHQLFCLKAFKRRHPFEGYMELSKEFVDYAKGLPLALEIFGSFLFGRSIKQWKSALDRLKEVPNREIFDVLKISYDELEQMEKKIFLDIACFFKGKDKDEVIAILDSCGFHAEIGIKVLVDKSLVTLLDNRLWMHDMIQEMGKEIIHQESPEEPGKRSRLWQYSDVRHVLMKNTGTEAVETMIVDNQSALCMAEWSRESSYLQHEFEEHRKNKISCNLNGFSNMSKIRLLKVFKVIDFPEGLGYLPNELRFFEWFRYPLRSLPSRFPPSKIVEIKMCYSKIERLWTGIENLENLRFITLKGSSKLINTPDFSGVPNLERLVLESCTSLVEVHPSIRFLKRLTLLNLKFCFRLQNLPSKLETESLEIIMLSSCPLVKEVPEFEVDMKHLSELWLDGTGIKELPVSLIKNSTSLALLDLSRCKDLICLPSNICSLTSLKKLKLSGCSILQELPDNLGNMECLEELDVSRTTIQELPSSIALLKNLKVLSFNGWNESPPRHKLYRFLPFQKCQGPMRLMFPSLSSLSSLTELNLSDCGLSDGAIPSNLGCLSSLTKLNLSRNNFTSLPPNICQLSKLTILDLESCRNLKSIPELPFNVQYMKIQDCASLETSSDLLKLGNLTEPTISCINCFKLVRSEGYSQVLHAMFKRYVQGLSYLRSRFDIIVPGNQIPDWFSQKCTGSSVVVQLPPHCDEAKFAGFVLCNVFVVKMHLARSIDSNCYFGPFTHKLGCHIKVNGQTSSRMPIFWFKEELDNIDVNDRSEHVWLLYLSRHYFRKTWQKSCNHVEFSFEVEGPGLEVKQSGASLVYEKDVEKLAAVNGQPI